MNLNNIPEDLWDVVCESEVNLSMDDWLSLPESVRNIVEPYYSEIINDDYFEKTFNSILKDPMPIVETLTPESMDLVETVMAEPESNQKEEFFDEFYFKGVCHIMAMELNDLINDDVPKRIEFIAAVFEHAIKEVGIDRVRVALNDVLDNTIKN